MTEREMACATYRRCNVGGTERLVDRTLAQLAPSGSRARDLLTPPETLDAQWFVDERPGHFGRLVDCLRHGTAALDFMKPYHAAIVRSLLGTAGDDGVSLDATDAMEDHSARTGKRAPQHAQNNRERADAERAHAIVVRLILDDGTVMDVARSTLCRVPPRSKPPRDPTPNGVEDSQEAFSILARIASGDPVWQPPTVGHRICIAQNARHFGLLVDCLRHGTGIVAHITSPYKLWGLRALGTYYGLDGLADAAQIAIGRCLCNAEPAQKVKIEVMDCATFAHTDGTEWHIESSGRPRGKVVLASNRMGHSEIAALARAAVGAPAHVGVFADPCADGWHWLQTDNARPYGGRDFAVFTGRGYSRVYVDRHPIDNPSHTTAGDDASSATKALDARSAKGVGDNQSAHQGRPPNLSYALVVVFDMAHARACNFGILAFDLSCGTESAGDTLIRACMRRDRRASKWRHVVAITRNCYDNYREIDMHNPLPEYACGGGAIWIAHGKPGMGAHDIVCLDVPIDPL
nr:BTB/POZ domain motif-containing [Pandoravirus massiliensis]